MTLQDYLSVLLKSPKFWLAVIAVLNAAGMLITKNAPQLGDLLIAFNSLIVAIGTILAGVELNLKRIAAK